MQKISFWTIVLWGLLASLRCSVWDDSTFKEIVNNTSSADESDVVRPQHFKNENTEECITTLNKIQDEIFLIITQELEPLALDVAHINMVEWMRLFFTHKFDEAYAAFNEDKSTQGLKKSDFSLKSTIDAFKLCLHWLNQGILMAEFLIAQRDQGKSVFLALAAISQVNQYFLVEVLDRIVHLFAHNWDELIHYSSNKNHTILHINQDTVIQEICLVKDKFESFNGGKHIFQKNSDKKSLLALSALSAHYKLVMEEYKATMIKFMHTYIQQSNSFMSTIKPIDNLILAFLQVQEEQKNSPQSVDKITTQKILETFIDRLLMLKNVLKGIHKDGDVMLQSHRKRNILIRHRILIADNSYKKMKEQDVLLNRYAQIYEQIIERFLRSDQPESDKMLGYELFALEHYFSKLRSEQLPSLFGRLFSKNNGKLLVLETMHELLRQCIECFKGDHSFWQSFTAALVQDVLIEGLKSERSPLLPKVEQETLLPAVSCEQEVSKQGNDLQWLIRSIFKNIFSSSLLEKLFNYLMNKEKVHF